MSGNRTVMIPAGGQPPAQEPGKGNTPSHPPGASPYAPNPAMPGAAPFPPNPAAPPPAYPGASPYAPNPGIPGASPYAPNPAIPGASPYAPNPAGSPAAPYAPPHAPHPSAPPGVPSASPYAPPHAPHPSAPPGVPAASPYTPPHAPHPSAPPGGSPPIPASAGPSVPPPAAPAVPSAPPPMVAPGLATTTNRPPAALRYEAPAQHHPLLLPMYEACQEILTFASELVFLQLPSAAEVFGSVQAMLDRFHQTATAASIPREDAMEAAYALAALLDESLVHVPQWRGADEWHRWPLQVRLFNDRNAGENFFARMTALEQQPHRVHVLQVYYLCLLLGFQGRYRLGRNDGIFPVLEQAATRLRGFIPAGEVMSPHGEVPDKPPPFLQREKLIVRACLGAFVLAVAVFFGMKGLLAWHARSTLEPLRNYAAEGEREAARSIAKP